MTIPELLMKHQHNLLALAKIRSTISSVAAEWGVIIQHEPGALFGVYLTADQEETASLEWYAAHICEAALMILKSENEELF